MEITMRGFVTVLHGLLFGGFFLTAIYGLGFEFFRSLFMKQPVGLTDRGLRFERAYLILVASIGWVVVISGAYIVYPWYRAIPPAGVIDLAQYPQRFLMSSPTTSGWHDLGMEWKEHVAWIAAISMTVVAYLLTKYRTVITAHPQIRTAIIVFIITALASGATAGVFGVMLNKNAPIQGGPRVQLMRGNK